MRQVILTQVLESKSFGEILGNLIWLCQMDVAYRPFVDTIVSIWWPADPLDQSQLKHLVADLKLRVKSFEETNSYWKTHQSTQNLQHFMLTHANPFSAESFYAPDYDAAREHCIVVLNIKHEFLS